MYKATFKPDGTRITTYADCIHDNIPDDAIEITDEEQILYATNEYIRDMVTGLPILKPIQPPTLDEQIAQIEAKYKLKFDSVEKRLTVVFLSGGIDQESKTIILQNEHKELSDQKDLEILELFGGVE